MKDIDFDELDKAVSSLMSGVKKDTNATQSPVSSDVRSSQNAPSRNEPGIPITAAPISPGTVKPKSALATNPDAQPAINPEPKPTAQPTSRTSAPAARRGGRFMDVVPKKPSSPAAPFAASREGTKISPRPGADVNTTAEPATPWPTPQTMTQPKPSETERAAPQNEWPDPIEIATAKKPPVTEEVPEAETTEVVDFASEPKKETPKDEPLSSPFLPGAKVEKRPLGATNLMVAPESAVSVPDDSDAQLPAKPSDVAQETPEEFGGDVMKVEADTHMGLPKTEDPIESKPAMPSPAQTPGSITSKSTELEPQDESSQGESQDESLSKSEVEEKVEESASSEKVLPVSSRISIPPQYKEQPSTGEQESGAIYDTSTYHQPLAHPAKKKSGWLWVLWIVVILIVGAGAGAALYFLGVV